MCLGDEEHTISSVLVKKSTVGGAYDERLREEERSGYDVDNLRRRFSIAEVRRTVR